MGYSATQVEQEPLRAELERMGGPAVIEFGTDWCGYCQAAQPLIESAFAGHPDVEHIKVEDGKGRPLGRSFRVKLWPTLIFWKGGQEVGRLVRPGSRREIVALLKEIDPPAPG